MYLLSRLRGKGRQRVTTLADAFRDTVLHTCFLAALGSSYTVVDEGVAFMFGKANTQRWRALFAGLVAGQSLRITGAERRHYSLATYILLRGLTLLVRTGNKPSAPPALRALLRPSRTAHGDTLLMCVAASQILYSFIMAPSTLPPTYVRFITRMGGKEPAIWEAMREHALRNAAGLAPGPLQALAHTSLAHLNARPGRIRATPCEFFHPGQSCLGHAAAVLPQAYGASLSVYVPFYLVSSVLVHRTALLAKPRELLPKMAVAVLRSSAFLSTYIAAAFLGACTGFTTAGANTGSVIAASVWAGGLATMLEKKSRRMELAMYCAARALEAFIRCCWLWGQATPLPRGAALSSAGFGGPHPRHGLNSRVAPIAGPQWLPPRPPGPLASRAAVPWPPLPPPRRAAAAYTGRGGGGHRYPAGGAGAGASSGVGGGLGGYRLDVLLFSLGCGAIMHCYSDCCGQHRDVFRSKYLNVLDFIFGNQGLEQGSITHVPNNLELVSTVGRRLRNFSRSVLSSTTVGANASGEYSPLAQSYSQSSTTAIGGGTPTASAIASGGRVNGTYGAGQHYSSSHAHANAHSHTRSQSHGLPSGFSPDSSATALFGQQGESAHGGSHAGSQAGGGHRHSHHGGGPHLGHPHHGAHRYERYLQQQQQHHQQLQQGSGQGLGQRPRSPSPTRLQQGGRSASAGGRSRDEAAGAAVAAEAAAKAGPAREGLAGRGSGRGSRHGDSSSRRGNDSGRSSSSSSGDDWEDVWAATTAANPQYGSQVSLRAAGASVSSLRRANGATAHVASPDGAVATAGGGGAAGGPPIPSSTSSGALAWAARLVAGALGSGSGGCRTATGPAATGRASNSSAFAAASNNPSFGGPDPRPAEQETSWSRGLDGAIGGGSTGMSVVRSPAAAAGGGRSVGWGLGSLRALAGGPAAAASGGGAKCGDAAVSSGGGLRRISTAPTGFTSPQMLLLLSDPDTERRGHGRSSYTLLQRLSGAGDEEMNNAGGTFGAVICHTMSPVSTASPPCASVPLAGAAGGYGMPLAAIEETSSPSLAPFSARSPSTAALSNSQPLPVPVLAKVRPLPVPNSASRAPAFRSSRLAPIPPPHVTMPAGGGGGGRPPLAGGSAAGYFTATTIAAAANACHTADTGSHLGGTTGSSSVESALNRMSGSSFSLLRNSPMSVAKRRSSGGGGAGPSGSAVSDAAVTFATHGAWDHPSPVSGTAPAWPRVSMDMSASVGAGPARGGSQGSLRMFWRPEEDGLVLCGSAPEGRRQALLAAEVKAAEEEAEPADVDAGTGVKAEGETGAEGAAKQGVGIEARAVEVQA